MAAGDIVLLVAMCAICVLMVMIEFVRLLRSCRGVLQDDGEWPSAPFRIAAWLFCGSSGTRPPVDDDGREKRIATRLAEVRVESYIAFLNVVVPLSACYATMWVLRLVLGLTHLSDPISAFLFALGYSAGLVLRAYPSLLNKDNVWMLHAFLMAQSTCYAAYLAFWTPSWFVMNYPAQVLIRTLECIMYPSAVPNNYWNALWVVVAICGHRNDPATRAAVPLNNTIGDQIALAAFLCWLTWRIQVLQVSQIRSDIQANWYRRAKNRMGKLLADMCDAVVELDPDLDIQTPCPKLAGLLLREPGTTSLNKESFPNLVLTEEDRQRFSSFVAERTVPMEGNQAAHGQRQSSSIFLSLRDVIGSAVPVQILHSCHHDPPEELCHIIGVREVEGQGNQDVARDTFGETGMRTGQQDETESVVSVSSSATGSWATDTPIVMAPLLPDSVTQIPISVIFNPLTYQIIASSIGFKSVAGPQLYKESLGDIIVNFQDFCAWLLVEVNGFFEKKSPEKIQLKVAPSLAKKQQASFEFHVEACILDIRREVQASVYGVETPEGEEEEFDMLCVMCFGNPEAKWLPDKKKRRGRLSRTFEFSLQVPEKRMSI